MMQYPSALWACTIGQQTNHKKMNIKIVTLIKDLLTQKLDLQWTVYCCMPYVQLVRFVCLYIYNTLVCHL